MATKIGFMSMLPPHPKWVNSKFIVVLLWAISRFNDQLPFRVILMPFVRITPKLFVGPQLTRRGWLALKKHGVTSIVNLRVELDDRERGIQPDHYLWLPTIDHTSPTVEQLIEAARFVKARIDAGEGVYIHCAAGVGRAPLVAAAYLVSEGMSVEQARVFLRQRRPFINQSESQKQRLVQFAEAIAADVR
ncbi:MAG: dual specificity protein phosphatase family protein [Anaerolineae bacterium]|nr:dual specificity protein phosphatase family protein [Anaerolineae bacterium]